VWGDRLALANFDRHWGGRSMRELSVDGKRGVRSADLQRAGRRTAW
jgi:hypothetical protein